MKTATFLDDLKAYRPCGEAITWARQFYRFYEKSEAFAWATKHHYRLIKVTA